MSSAKKARVAVVGATGYAGAELVRLLIGHPHADIQVVTSEKDAGRPLSSVHPYLGAAADLELVKADADGVADAAELAFVALPHGASTPIVRRLIERGLRVVDVGADFRFTDLATYERWYGEHSAPELLAESVYGLTEHARVAVAGARLVANPGCYPTGALLGLLPLAELIDGPVMVDSKSGTSGAGRAASTAQLFAEVTENIRPYSVWKHRHEPEMRSQLASAGADVAVLFTPHLLPIARGLLSTCYLALSDLDALGARLEEAYGDEPFVRLLGEGGLPEPRNVRGTNMTEIGWMTDPETGRAVVMTALDNLGKGAAGQAVQNFNCMLGFPETTGLQQLAALP